jgi:pyruvate formate lyase activating enzyme
MIEALYYVKKEDKRVLCTLCPHGCRIEPGEYGFCMARKNIGGVLYSENYGKISSLALDPIEKKPFNRFMPGSYVLSFGMFGCNMNCPFCQNYRISRTRPPVETMTAEDIVQIAENTKSRGNIGVAYTYNEPLIGYEFVLDCCKKVKESGMKNILVSNGFLSSKPLEELIPYVDAANIDLKCYDQKTYKDTIGGELKVVKNTVKKMFQAGVHVEVTMLIVPDVNDRPEEFEEATEFLAELSCEIPLHISRYFPARMYNKPPTDIRLMDRLKKIAERRLRYVYLGNV